MKFIKIFLSALLCFVVSAESPASENGTQDFRRVYVARHGQRPAKGDPRLTELGVKQAAMLAERIKSVGFDDGKIYVSPYLRTVETGVQIAKLFGKKVILTPSIQERTKVPGAPDIAGLTQAELEKLFPDSSRPNRSCPTTGFTATTMGKFSKCALQTPLKSF